MITKNILIVMVWVLNGNIQTSTYEVDECPPQHVLEEYYDSLKDDNKIVEWSAWCTQVPWDPSIRI
tara:strand:- start:4076 stop:4273 length:198 start_codon:yes stop_codon:yes gene_type:complete